MTLIHFTLFLKTLHSLAIFSMPYVEVKTVTQPFSSKHCWLGRHCVNFEAWESLCKLHRLPRTQNPHHLRHRRHPHSSRALSTRPRPRHSRWACARRKRTMGGRRGGRRRDWRVWISDPSIAGNEKGPGGLTHYAAPYCCLRNHGVQEREK